MNNNISKECKNAFNIFQEYEVCTPKITLEDVTAMTLVIEKEGFAVQSFEPDIRSTKIYYIQKYQKVLTLEQTITFLNEHPTEKFLFISDVDSDEDDIWCYISSKPGFLTVYCFHCVGGGHMTLFAILRNIPNASKWDEPEIINNSRVTITNFDPQSCSRRSVDENMLYVKFANRYSSRDKAKIINSPNTYSTSFKEMLRTSLRLSGITRITRDPSYRDIFRFDVGKQPRLEHESINRRYGLLTHYNDESMFCEEHSYIYKYAGSLMFIRHETFDSPVPQEDWDRVCHRLKIKLEAMAQANEDNYRTLVSAAIVLITEPIKGHRRPSFHYIRGFRSNDITEIVELSRGELLIKDMIPEEIYCLTEEGTYIHVTRQIKGDMRSLITSSDTEIDSVTYNKWAEERSLHPELLKLLSESYFDTIKLDTVKLFNRLPFGALLIDQLITSGHVKLAIALAHYITDRAYDPNYFCSQLSDLFPHCNNDETSLYKILNLSRNTAKYLFDNADSVDKFIALYAAIYYYGGNLTLTEEIKVKVETYLALFKVNMHQLSLSFGNRTFDFLEYPRLAKQVVRMRNKINALTNVTSSEKTTILIKYNEIVRAYASFIDYQKIAPAEEKAQWDPSTQRIFVEFSLTGTLDNPLDPLTEIDLREKHANRALKIYQGRADAEVVKQNEEKYAYRKHHAINKLRSLAAFTKETGYIVMVPTQVYGFEVVGSIEKEGYDQDHCLFRQYTNQIVNGEFTPLWLRLKDKPDESLVTFSITKEGRIDQTRGHGDREITATEAKAIAAWAISKQGMVTFKSEGQDVAPGGWPRKMGVPSLPKPDTLWLKQLSQTYKEKI